MEKRSRRVFILVPEILTPESQPHNTCKGESGITYILSIVTLLELYLKQLNLILLLVKENDYN